MGRGFIYDNEKKEYYAKYDGKITYRDDRLQIESELIIEGDVSFSNKEMLHFKMTFMFVEMFSYGS